MIDVRLKTDQELVALSLKDDKYFEFIIERYEQKLSRYVLRIYSLCKESVEDVLQEVFIKLYQNLNDFDDQYSFSSWIYRITHNVLISHLRKMDQKHVLVSIDNDDSARKLVDSLPADVDLEEEFERKDLVVNLEKALGKIPDKYREVLVLYYFEEKSYKEICDILRRSLGSVSVLMNRAKAKLKTELMSFNQ
ncbi:RNA polymerase sigma factor [Candidatus Gracilibacteria bacterium]|nr:RNA polymerase sigma factor [Candidatus Gracilibacteria bacterium]